MAKFTWQDGTLVSKAKVEIGGTIYEVDPEEYSGATPLSASNLNAMQDGIYEDINGIVESGSGYVKYADGTLICYGKSNTAEIPYGSEYSETITLPESYKDNNFIVLTSITSGGASWANVICRGGATSENTIKLIAGNYIVSGSTARDIILSYVTIGKWK
jgi:hypothetical protein